MAQYDDKLKQISEIMSKIPGNAPWSEKISLLSGRRLNYDEKVEIDRLENAWKKCIKFKREVGETRDKQDHSARATILPLGIIGLGGISFAILFELFIVAVLAALPLLLSLCWSSYQSYIQTRNRRYTRTIDWYDQQRFL